IVPVPYARFAGGEQAAFDAARGRVIAVFDALAAIDVNGVPNASVLEAGKRVPLVERCFEPAGLVAERAETAAAAVDPVVLGPADERVGEAVARAGRADKIERVIVAVDEIGGSVGALDEGAVVGAELGSGVLAAGRAPLEEKPVESKRATVVGVAKLAFEVEGGGIGQRDRRRVAHEEQALFGTVVRGAALSGAAAGENHSCAIHTSRARSHEESAPRLIGRIGHED